MANLAKEIERYRAKVNFQHKFENVNYPNIWIRSPSFFARNISFCLHLGRNEGGIFCNLIWNEGAKMPAELQEGHSLNVVYQLSLITPSKTTRSAEISATLNYQDYLSRTNLSEIFPAEEIIVDDAITIKVSLWVGEPEGKTEFKPPKEKLRQELQNGGDQELRDCFSSLLDSEDFSDVTFVVSEDCSKVKAHKNILAARSPVFARMLTSDMKEAKDNEIRVDDMGATALKIMLRHIYTGQLGFPKGIEIDLKICMELANAGEKYDLQKLKKYAAMAMTEFVSLENAWELLSFVERLNAKAATKALASFYSENDRKCG